LVREDVEMSGDERDAIRIARTIERRWAALGYASVSCKIERIDLDGKSVSYEVRCNLVNGLPSDFRPEDVRRLENG
jgi:hypothetical protein